VRRTLATSPLVGLVVAWSVLLAGCGGAQAGTALARQACVYVKTSITLFNRAAADPGAAGQALRAQAADDLEAAVPLAAGANTADPMWNPLVTTLQEAGKVDERYLLTALRAQCALADSPNPQAPIINDTVPSRSSPSTLPRR
jgi:hypothetical protein